MDILTALKIEREDWFRLGNLKEVSRINKEIKKHKEQIKRSDEILKTKYPELWKKVKKGRK